MQKILKIGDRVWAQGKRVGKVAQILVDEEKQEPRYVVIRVGRIRRRDIIIPASSIESLDAEGVKLRLDKTELLQHPDVETEVTVAEYQKPFAVGRYRPGAVYTPSANREFSVLKQRNYSDSLKAVRRGMSVIDASGTSVGKVHGVIADERRVKQLILRHPEPLLIGDRVIQAEWIEEVCGDEVHLGVEARDLYDSSPHETSPVDDAE
jgi:sporulation protein YlmC with PRC-barrel domain